MYQVVRKYRFVALCQSFALATLLAIETDMRAAPPAVPPSNASAEELERFFEEKVHPILASRCYECHGADAQEGGLRLDSRDAILKGGESGEPAVKLDAPATSRLLKAIRHEGDLQMPPAAKLAEPELQVLTAWVSSGLPWSRNADAVKALSTDERAKSDRENHWAFRPVQRPPLPTVHDSSWPSTGVDHFILAKLEKAGLKPSERADRRTLIRRISFDLLGLPPTQEEVDEFIADDSPGAYERLVDRYLSSPHYGERWARHWLDVARYADTRGYAFGRERRYPYAYTYRDYVIGALNADKPYDQFVMEQVAADRLQLEDKTSLAAMGFLTTGRKFNNREDDIDDQIDVVTRGLLGITVACARCHDHKYDSVPTEDYYSLHGIFASSKEPDDLPLIAQDVKQIAGYQEFQKELEKRQGELNKFRSEKHAEIIKTAREKVGDYLLRAAAPTQTGIVGKVAGISLGRDELKPRMIDRWRAYLRQHNKPDDPIFGPWNELIALPEAEFVDKAPAIIEKWNGVPPGLKKGELHPLVKAAISSEPLTSREALAAAYGKVFNDANAQYVAAGGNEDAMAKLPPELHPLVEIIAGKTSPTSIGVDDLRNYLNRADRNQERELEKKIEAFQASSPAAPPRAMVLVDAGPRDSRVLQRGNPGRPGNVVPRRFLLVLSPSERKPYTSGSGRLELAQEIVAPQNPLTRRVIANRIWMHHFSDSLVRTPSDFGVRCDEPIHRDLLDYLAARILEEGWSLKALHREIVLSSTYQQKSDSTNIAESDPENRLYWRMNRRRLEFEILRDSLLETAGVLDRTMNGRPVNITTTPFTHRRTIYGFIDRQDLPNLFRVFDFASPDQSQAERPKTTVPQQALFLMNSPFAIEQAKALAARPEVANCSDVQTKLSRMYQLTFQREPTAAELEIAVEFVQAAESATDAKPGLSNLEQYAQLLLLTNEFCYVD